MAFRVPCASCLVACLATTSGAVFAQPTPADRPFTWSETPIAARVDTPHPTAPHANEPAKTGHLRVKETTGAAVDVIVDDVRVGPAPWEGAVAAGYHVVKLVGPNRESPPQSVRVEPDGRSDLAVEASRTDAKLEISVFPRTAAIAINGRRMGFGAFRANVPVGYYHVEVQAPGVGRADTGVTLEPGQYVSKELVIVDRGPTDGPDDESDPARSYRGFVAQVGLMGAKARASTTSDREPGGGKGFADLPDLAGGGFLRLGHAFGPISVEVTGAVLADYRGENQVPGNLCDQLPVDGCAGQSSTWMSYGLAAMGGLGGHLSTTTQGLRLTAGGSVGVAHRAIRMVDQVSGNQVGAEAYTAPALLLDLGLLIGSTPGTKLFVGGVAWIDWPASDVKHLASSDQPGVQPTTYVLASGRQTYVGPALALQLGH
jgi:hypothetical protein